MATNVGKEMNIGCWSVVKKFNILQENESNSTTDDGKKKRRFTDTTETTPVNAVPVNPSPGQLTTDQVHVYLTYIKLSH